MLEGSSMGAFVCLFSSLGQEGLFSFPFDEFGLSITMIHVIINWSIMHINLTFELLQLWKTYNRNDDYVLQYFLTPMCKGCDE
jgi:hypothetical protein